MRFVNPFLTDVSLYDVGIIHVVSGNQGISCLSMVLVSELLNTFISVLLRSNALFIGRYMDH